MQAHTPPLWEAAYPAQLRNYSLDTSALPINAAALAEAVLDYVNLTAAAKLELKQQTRARVEQDFSIQQVSQQYMAAWRQQA